MVGGFNRKVGEKYVIGMLCLKWSFVGQIHGWGDNQWPDPSHHLPSSFHLESSFHHLPSPSHHLPIIFRSSSHYIPMTSPCLLPESHEYLHILHVCYLNQLKSHGNHQVSWWNHPSIPIFVGCTSAIPPKAQSRFLFRCILASRKRVKVP